MVQLTVDLQTSSEIMGADPESFLNFLRQSQSGGVINLNNTWRVSIFTLAEILNTSPTALLDTLEDYELGRLIESVDDDDFFDADEGQKVYQQYLAEA